MLANESLVQVYISPDELTAYLTLSEPLPGESFSLEQLEKVLQDKGKLMVWMK
jgi:hypothetical protein